MARDYGFVSGQEFSMNGRTPERSRQTYICDMKLGVQGSVDAEGVQEVQGEAVSLADGAAAAGDASSCGNKKAIRRVQLLKALAKN